MNDPISLMLACHERIRRFTGGLSRLAALEDLRDPQAAPAAEAIARYLRMALPLHAADEDESLTPRLQAHCGDGRVFEALEVMERQHREIHGGLPRVLRLLDAVIEGPPPSRAALSDAADWLCTLMEAHLALEEAVIFPAALDLPPEALAEMAEEMPARRGLSPAAARAMWGDLGDDGPRRV